ncbi:hypothetical protein PHYBOEH_001571 [Phytophthora boehmeriae]|uniref:Centrosomal protein of 70 kDa n=1 Tax=Phytophthora boehmeriae TaxID=109152 RepID=A0A8T1WUQ4_9STRA|nr:hypothetical protein PHYBOEH_001571 [Phytophthora boehmeriae]
MDESLSSVDQFLRDNGFSISDPAIGLTSLSGDEVLDEELLLSDADERPPPLPTSSSRSSDESPRFVLLEDQDLLLGDGERETQTQERLSGDRTSERRESEGQAASWRAQDKQPQQEEEDSLDRSMLFGGSELSLSSIEPRMDRMHQSGAEQQSALSAPPSEASSSGSLVEMQSASRSPDRTRKEEEDEMAYQTTPHREAPSVREAAFVSAASSSSLPPSLSHSATSSGKVLDDELNDALGVPRSGSVVTQQLSISEQQSQMSASQKRSTRSGDDHSSQRSGSSRASRTQQVLFPRDDNEGTEQRKEGGTSSDRIARAVRGSRDEKNRWSNNSSESDANFLFGGEAEEKKEDNDDESVSLRNTHKGSTREQGSTDVGEGNWIGLNDLLRKNGLPAVQFRQIGSCEALPDRDSLFSAINDFVVQLERKNEAIQELVLASNRNSRVRSRREGELQTSEKKNEGTQRALEKAKAEIERLKALQKKESEEAKLAAKKLKNSCLRLQQQLKVSEHRVKAKEVLVEKMQAKLQQQVDKENMNKTRDRRAFRNIQDRDLRRANPRDIQALETIGVYETQREQMQEELEHLRAQVAALNSELRDKDNFIARQGNAALNTEPPIWDAYSDEGTTTRVSGTHSRSRHRYGSSSVASDEVMLEQLEAARREQEVAAAKLRHREAVMIKKVAMIEQELLAARETIGELKEENANLTLEAESRPSIRDYRLSQRRIHHLERQVAENKLALEEASDLNELRKYMGTKELVERDRLNHRLHLNRLNTLPRETTLEVVKHVCRVLHLTDITLIAPTLDKLCSVVAAVPRMEKFIRDVCGFVFLHVSDGVEAKDGENARFELEQVLPTLQQWMMERRKLHALENFKTSIVTELCKRSVEPSVLTSQESCEENNQVPPTTLSRAVHIVSDLVELEKSVLHHREIYTQAASELERRPNVLINQIVRHFSHLFEVKSVEGVLPKINETYLLVNEMKNFINTIRDLLHLKKDTPIVHCLNAIKGKLQGYTLDPAHTRPEYESENHVRTMARPGNAYDGGTPNFVVEKHRLQERRQDGNQADLVGVRQVREMSILVRELKRELGAATMDEILPRTKRLMELLSLSIHNADPGGDESDYE